MFSEISLSGINAVCDREMMKFINGYILLAKSFEMILYRKLQILIGLYSVTFVGVCTLDIRTSSEEEVDLV